VKVAAGLSALATCICLIAVVWSDPGGVDLPADELRPRQQRSFTPQRDEGLRSPTASIPAGRSGQVGQPDGIWPPPARLESRVPRPPRLARDYPQPRTIRLPATAPPALPRWNARPQRVDRRHRIADGDTLPRLAERYLGSAERYLEIYEHNRDVLHSPDELPIGVELRIPTRMIR
jgi:nucleoid-associated protein YgaU